MNFRYLLFVVGLTAPAAFAQETVTLLDRGEPYDSMVADHGTLWVGQSRRNFNGDYRVEAFKSDGTFLDRVTLTHSLMSIKPVGDGSVRITGINPSARLTEYTTAKLVNGRIQSTTTRISLSGFISFWIGDLNGRHYFADVGGNPNDDDGDIQLPAQTIFYAARTEATYMTTRLRMPTDGLILDGKAYLMSSEGMGSTSAKIVEVDPRTQAVRVLYQSRTAGMTNLEPIAAGTMFLSAGRAESKLIVTERATGRLVHEFLTAGYTRMGVEFGHCVLAANDETNLVQGFDLRTNANEPVFQAQVRLPATEFSGIKKIAVDAATGTLFARASFPCNPMVTTCDQDYNRVVKFAPYVTAELIAACR